MGLLPLTATEKNIWPSAESFWKCCFDILGLKPGLFPDIMKHSKVILQISVKNKSNLENINDLSKPEIM